MDSDDVIAARYTRRARDAANFAIRLGADPDAVRDAIEEGIADAVRAQARIAAAEQPAAELPRPKFVPKPGSAIERFLNAVG
ncbi:hypothetical protein ABNF97_09490 [Plantactinospora sp. B6F1]|uniref:hypothetical protein n=1 Tax=Plantactinospora sp. B6F1 TaxID=3158971 RepID=UPI0032D9262D